MELQGSVQLPALCWKTWQEKDKPETITDMEDM